MASEGERGEPAVVNTENEKLPYGWNRQTDANGVVCYKNIITNEVQYEVPTQRARPKPRSRQQNENGGEPTPLTATQIAANKAKPKYAPSSGAQRCITLCVGAPYQEDYNDQYSHFTERKSDCQSWGGSICFHTLSILKNGGCMMLLLPWALVVDMFSLFVSATIYVPPCCIGQCFWMSEYKRVGWCCAGTFCLRSSFGFPCCYDGECDCYRCLLFSDPNGNLFT